MESNHNAHHARPNDPAHDPNVNILFLACSPEQARSRPRWVQSVIRHQVALLVPIFCLEFFSMHHQSIEYALRRQRAARGRSSGYSSDTTRCTARSWWSRSD